MALEAYSKYFMAFEKVSKPHSVRQNLQNSGHWFTLFH